MKTVAISLGIKMRHSVKMCQVGKRKILNIPQEAAHSNNVLYLDILWNE